VREVIGGVDVEHRDILTNGIRLHGAIAGPPDGELVVLLHGLPEFWAGMRAPLRAFAAAGYRVVAPDQRGYNLSDKPGGLDAYRLDVLGADVIGLVDALGRDRAHVVGHDWGAAVAWWLAAAHPERLSSVAVVNVPHPLALAARVRRDPRQLLRSWYMGAFQLPLLPDSLLGARSAAALARVMVRTSNPGSITPGYLAELRAAWGRPGAITGMLAWYRAALRRPARWPRGPRVQQPLLILWGARDVALREELARDSLRLCDAGHLLVFEGATHWLLHDEPGPACAALLAWAEGREVVEEA